MSELSFDRLAKGGIIDHPIIAEIGEAGREAVIPLENNKAWIKELAMDIKQSMTTAPGVNNINSFAYGEMVNAFKDALSQMKVVLDDEEMGGFIEKTVADAIYI